MEDKYFVYLFVVILLIILIGVLKFNGRVKFYIDFLKGKFGFEGDNVAEKRYNVSIIGGPISNSGTMKVSSTNIKAGSFENKGELEISSSDVSIVENQKKSKSR